MKRALYVISFICCLCLASADLFSQSAINGHVFHAMTPALITSCGQSPDAFTVSAAARRIGVEHLYDDLIDVPELNGFKTVIVVTGASLKGLGEAGFSVSMELSRVSALLAKAKTAGVKVIAVHIGGEARRGANSEKFIDLVIARADCIIATLEGNKDGKFSKEAQRLGIPLFLLKAPKDIGDLLQRIFRI